MERNQRLKWSQRQNLIYELYFLLHQQFNGLAGQKSFKKLVAWLENSKSQKQSALHHKKMVKGFDKKAQFVLYLIKKNYTQRKLKVSHIQKQIEGSLRKAMENNDELRKEVRILVRRFIQKWMPLQNQDYEIELQKNIQESTVSQESAVKQSSPNFTMKIQKQQSIASEKKEEGTGQVEVSWQAQPDRMDQWSISNGLVIYQSDLSN